MKLVSKLSNQLVWLFIGIVALGAQRPAYLKLEFDKNQKPFVYYPVNKGDTQEDLCKYFGCTLSELRLKNHLSSGQTLVAGHTVQVPVNPDQIIKKNLKGKYDGILPLYYTIKKGETAYRIVKVNLKDDINNFYERNKLENNQLKLGAEVLVGWIDLRSAKEKGSKQLVNTSVKEKENSPGKAVVVKNKTQKEEATIFKKVVSEKNTGSKPDEAVPGDVAAPAEPSEVWVSDRGVAYWQHGHRANTNKYVLHNTAAINSVIELYNPMLKRSVRAKVIGRIPDETYRNDIDVVLSEGAAESLGALDSRFQVEMRYIK